MISAHARIPECTSPHLQLQQTRIDDLLGTYVPGLFRYAYWLCGNRKSAENLVEDTVLLTWRTLDSYPDNSSVRRQLITNLRNEFIRNPSKYCGTGAADGFPLGHLVTGMSIEDTDAREVVGAFARMRPEFREALMLQILMDCTIKEMAGILNVTQGEICARLCRARGELLRLLDPGDKMLDELLI